MVPVLSSHSDLNYINFFFITPTFFFPSSSPTSSFPWGWHSLGLPLNASTHKRGLNRSSVAMAQQNKLMTGKYTNLVSQWGLPCDKHTKRKRPFSTQQKDLPSTTPRLYWNWEQMESLLIPPAYRTSPTHALLIFPLQEWPFFFSSFFQESLVIIIKKTKPKTLYSSIQAFSRIFDFQGSVALSSFDPVWWGADRENDLGDESASSFRESIVVLSCKTSRIPTSLQRSYVLVSSTIPGTCAALGHKYFYTLSFPVGSHAR